MAKNKMDLINFSKIYGKITLAKRKLILKKSVLEKFVKIFPKQTFFVPRFVTH